MGGSVMVVRVLLAAVFVVAAATKLASLESSRRAAAALGVPKGLAKIVGTALPFVELAIAVTLVDRGLARGGAIAASILLASFTALLVANLARGRRPPCNCFGQSHDSPISGATVIRNLVLLTAALTIAVAGPGRDVFDVIGSATAKELVVASVIGVLALAVSLQGWAMVQLMRRHGAVLLRLDALEAASEAGAPAPTPRAVPVELAAGLPVGARAPEFSLVGLHGETMTLEALRAGGRPVLLVFSDANCGPCAALTPQLVAWQRDLADQLRVVVIAGGSADVNRAKAVEHGLGDVLLEEGRGVGAAYRYEGTPGAVVVDVGGRIASSVASGAPAITELVRRLVAGESLARPIHEHHHHHGHQEPVHHSDGLPLGAVAPSFNLPTVGGGEVSLSEYAGRDVAVVFWNPRCGYCNQLLPDLLAWEADRPTDAPELLVISTGDDAANAAMGFASTVALDAAGSAMASYRTTGTPTGVLVGADGRITSELAVGGPAVRQLLHTKEVAR